MSGRWVSGGVLLLAIGCRARLADPSDGAAADVATGLGDASIGEDAGVDAADVRPTEAEPGDGAWGDPTPTDLASTDIEPGDADPSPSDSAPPSCGVGDVAGSCIDVASCDSGEPQVGLCTGAFREQCCVPGADACSVDGVPGLCLDTSSCLGGFLPTPGYCPGPAYIQCCREIGRTNTCDPDAAPLVNEGLVELPGQLGCGAGMLRLADLCIDQYEASLRQVDAQGNDLGSFSPYKNPGSELVRAVSVAWAVPQGYVNANQAEAACQRAGKRLCTSAEWLSACRGAAARTYPYGNMHIDGACNDERSPHPAIEYFGTSQSWIWSQLGNSCINQLPVSVALTGAYVGCSTPEGLLDMVGNLHEWVADAAGTFRGGFYVDAVLNGTACLYATTAHDRSHWDYSTGFRCCADPTP